MKLTLKQLKKMIMEQVEVAASESEENKALMAWAWALFQLSMDEREKFKIPAQEVFDKLRQGNWGNGWGNAPFKKEYLRRIEEITGQKPVELLRKYIELDKEMRALKSAMRKARDQIEPLVQHDED